MADVHVATDRVLGREVAVKVLRESEPDETDRARFVSEAQTLARLSHPGLVTVLDAGTTAERPYLVMELVRGITLADAIAGGRIAPRRVAQIGAQVADALAYVHAAGVVHRDVKPGNVLLQEDGRARLTDFGIARLVEDTTHRTRTGTTIGSPAYFSPEQVSGGVVTTASDLYSLGLVLVEALSGQRVFGGTPTEAAIARLSRAPELPDDLPPGWAALLTELTDRDPLRRPDATRAADRLRALAAGQVPSASATSVMPQQSGADATRVVPAVAPPPRPAAEPPRREPDGRGRDRSASRYVLLCVALVGVVAALVVAGTLLTRDDGTVPDVPQDVPAELQQPLQDLHDAVEEAGR